MGAPMGVETQQSKDDKVSLQRVTDDEASRRRSMQLSRGRCTLTAGRIGTPVWVESVHEAATCELAMRAR